MKSKFISIEAASSEEWDLVIVGTGLGGASFGFPLKDTDLKVLFIEKSSAYESHNIEPLVCFINGKKVLLKKPPIYNSLGGSSRYYAAHLERMSPHNFSETSDWGLSYKEILPYYLYAEEIFNITGSIDPLAATIESNLRNPPSLTAAQAKFFKFLQNKGLSPYQPHMAIDYKDDCTGCGGLLCKQQCKNDAFKSLIVKIFNSENNFKIISGCEVSSIKLKNSTEIDSILCTSNGVSFSIKSKFFTLSAGALGTPLILLKSQSEKHKNGISNSSGMVGKCLMWHTSDIFAVFIPNKDSIYNKSIKFLSLNDFNSNLKIKIGNIQSVGVLLSEKIVYDFLVRNSIFSYLPSLLLKLFSRVLYKLTKNFYFFATIVEDYPTVDNKIIYDKNKNDFYIKYDIDDQLYKRTKLLYSKFKTILGFIYPSFCLTNHKTLNYGHACGTCRMSLDRKEGVVDQSGRSHDISNLYISDSSVFSTSAGINPSLTIIALGLKFGTEFRKNNASK